MTDKQIYQIGLTMINGVGDILARHLLEALGDAEAVFTEKRQSLEKISGIGDSIITEIKRADVLLRAEKELAFAQKNGISIYFLKDMNYPERLRECPDAPVLFYFKGNADLNAAHIISVVGTRRASTYGQEVTERLLRDLSVIFPDLLVVSGLAYGIDICAHRNALKNQLPTVGVLAHGLDRIYPPVHRSTAVEMLERSDVEQQPPAIQPQFYIHFPPLKHCDLATLSLSDAMQPDIPAGSYVLLRRQQPDELLPGSTCLILSDAFKGIRVVRQSSLADELLLLPRNSDAYDPIHIKRDAIHKLFVVEGIIIKKIL